MDIDLYVTMTARLGEPESAMRTYDHVKARLNVDARLRCGLWATIEQRYVEQRRYEEAVAENDVALAELRFYLARFRAVTAEDESKEPVYRVTLEYAIDSRGGVHFEALIGAGQTATAGTLADELINFRPTAATFAVLVKHARRVNALQEVDRLLAKAQTALSSSDFEAVQRAASAPN